MKAVLIAAGLAGVWWAVATLSGLIAAIKAQARIVRHDWLDDDYWKR